MIRTDVLVIGAGGAGLRAAIAAADCGVQVLLVSKGKVGKAGATSYPVAEMAGYNAGDVCIPGDVEAHFRDMVAAGHGMADERLAAVVAANAPGTIEQLENWGVRFDREGDGLYVFKSCFSSGKRTHVLKGHGEPIVRALMAQMRQRPSISVMEDFTVAELLVKDGECRGAFGVHGGEEVCILARAVVVASGGCGQAFQRNMNPSDVTGMGYSVAYRAGCDLVNMEFMQIGMGFSWPVVNIFNGYLWEVLPRISDGSGGDIFASVLPPGLTAEDVMHEHRRHFPFSSSDDSKYLEIAVQQAVQQGRTAAHGGVMVDFTDVTDAYVSSIPDDCGIHHLWPVARDHLLSRGVDLTRDRAEVSCFAHAVNGGIRIDVRGESSVRGLFAAGECAGGPHGADRLGGNMMVTCQVFGRIAGVSAAERALAEETLPEDGPFPGLEKARRLLYADVDAGAMLSALQRCTQKNLLVSRTEQGLLEVLALTEAGLAELEGAGTRDRVNTAAVDLLHMLTAVRIIAGSALQRRESRGSHHRADHPETSPAYAAPIIVNQRDADRSKNGKGGTEEYLLINQKRA